ALLVDDCKDPTTAQRVAAGAMRALDGAATDESLGAAAASLLGHCALPRVAADAHDVEPRTRGDAIGWLVAFERNRDRTAVRAHVLCALGALARDADEDARAVALDALAGAAAARQETPHARAAAVLGLAQLRCGTDGRHGARAHDALRRALGDGAPLVRRTAALSLAQTSTRPGAAPPAELLGVRRILARGVLGGRASDRPWFALALGYHLQRGEALGLEAPKDAQRRLVRGLLRARGAGETGAFALAAALASSASQRGAQGAHAVRGIERALDRFEGPEERAPLHEALGILGGGRATESEEALERTLEGARAGAVVRWHALRAIRLDGGSAARARALALLASRDGPDAVWGARLAGQLHDGRLLDRLLELTADDLTRGDDRIAAVEALGDRAAAAPWAAPLARTTPFFSPLAGSWEQDA
ncbi:MAG: hypothetical protein AAFP86_19775, partial [Planctomycetota bacterium]